MGLFIVPFTASVSPYSHLFVFVDQGEADMRICQQCSVGRGYVAATHTEEDGTKRSWLESGTKGAPAEGWQRVWEIHGRSRVQGCSKELCPCAHQVCWRHGKRLCWVARPHDKRFSVPVVSTHTRKPRRDSRYHSESSGRKEGGGLGQDP